MLIWLQKIGTYYQQETNMAERIGEHHEDVVPDRRIRISEMPDRETLEAFLEGQFGQVRVTFDAESGRFSWITQRNEIRPFDTHTSTERDVPSKNR